MLDSGSAQPWFWLVLAVPVVAISLCGSREPWAIGLVGVLMSLCYILRPPTRPIHTALLCFLLAVPALALTAFLPFSKSAEPFWRTALTTEHAIELGGLVSPQPAVTAEGWVMLTLGVLWLLYCLKQDFSRQEVRIAIQFCTIFIAVIAAIAIGLLWSKREIPLWQGEWMWLRYFGPFPNRNHFGGLLAVGAVLAFAAAFDALQRQKPLMAVLYGICVVPMFTAMLLNTSRMGVALFFAGLSLWMAIGTSRKYTRAQIAVALSILLILASGFILFGDAVMARLQLGEVSLSKVISSEGRFGIYLDTLRMMSLSPWSGVGLENFEPVFSMTRETIDTESRALHPESDWLWLGAEAGVPALICALIGAVILTVTCGPWGKRRKMTSRGRRLSITAGVAALIFPAQSVIDTPLHGVGVATFTALIIGLAGSGRPMEALQATPVRKTYLWAGLGLVVCALGTSLLMTDLTGTAYTPRARFDELEREAGRLKDSGDRAAAVQTWTKAATIRPLQWNIYFERALLKLELGYSPQEALVDFSRARYLEQTFGRICMTEAEIWFLYNPPYAIPALREAMARDSTRAYGFYDAALQRVHTNPELRPALRSLATTPSLQFLYLSTASGAEFESALKEFLVQHPTLEGMKPADRLRLFQLWYTRGNAMEVVQRIEETVDWQQSGWPVLAEHRAKQGDFASAYELAISHLPKPTLRPRTSGEPEDSLRRQYLRNPQDALIGLELFWVQRATGNRDAALTTLKELALLKNAPAAVYWEMATLLADGGDYLQAWGAIQEYMRKITPAS